jgi:hypothetical protein
MRVRGRLCWQQRHTHRNRRSRNRDREGLVQQDVRMLQLDGDHGAVQERHAHGPADHHPSAVRAIRDGTVRRVRCRANESLDRCGPAQLRRSCCTCLRACTQDDECTTNHCVGATVQPGGPNTDGACKPLPTAGQDCSFKCASGLYCGYDMTAGKSICQTPKANGASCTSKNECSGGDCAGAGSGSPGMCADAGPTCTGK